MLTLLLLRHAKAEPAGRVGDHDRGLVARGEGEAGAVGTFLREHRLRPDLALVSTARRTQQTFALAAERFVGALAAQHEPALYDAGAGAILRQISRVDGVASLLVVGHNPGIMEAAVALAQGGDLAEIERLRARFPPAGLAVLGFASESWADACASGGTLDALVFPEDLDG